MSCRSTPFPEVRWRSETVTQDTMSSSSTPSSASSPSRSPTPDSPEQEAASLVLAETEEAERTTRHGDLRQALKHYTRAIDALERELGPDPAAAAAAAIAAVLGPVAWPQPEPEPAPETASPKQTPRVSNASATRAG